MDEENKRPSLDDLGERVRAAREHRRAGKQGTGMFSGASAGMSGLSWAFRVGVEMVSALVVGVGIGWLLDWWLGTGPWLLVLFFFLGAGAGILNVFRSAMGYGLAVGYRKPGEEEDGTDSGAKQRPDDE